MSEKRISADRTTRIRSLHEARARREIALADALAPGSDVVAWRGSLMPAVAVLKGLPGPAEAAGGAALSGADGEAVVAGLAKLGYEERHLFFTLTRPEPGLAEAERIARTRALVEAVDAPLVVALDPDAAADVAAAYGLERLSAGKAVRSCGRRLVVLDGLEASLADEQRKRLVWSQMKAAAPEGPVY